MRKDADEEHTKKKLPDVDENTLIYTVLHGKDTSARFKKVGWKQLNEKVYLNKGLMEYA